VNILERLLRASSPEVRQTIAQQNDALIDVEFFQILSLNAQMAQAQGQGQAAQQLMTLHQQLVDWTTTGQELAAREEAIRELGSEVSREELLEKLIAAAKADRQAKVETMVAVARQVIDYAFFQQLAARIEAAQTEGDAGEAETLKSLRADILEITSQIDAEVEQASREAVELLEQIVHADDLEQAVRDNLEAIDDLFLAILARNIEAAEQSGRTEDVEKLNEIGEVLMQLIQESQPPAVQLINQLLSTEYPDGTRALLEENRPLLEQGLPEVMQMVEEDLGQRGRNELARQLAQIRAQATEMLS
jgi:hypothetical protein